MKLFFEVIVVTTIITSLLWFTSLFTNIPIYNYELNPIYDEITVVVSHENIEVVRILIYNSEIRDANIVSFYKVIFSIKENQEFFSIVEKVSCNFYSARVKPLFVLSNVMNSDDFEENVIYVLSRVGVLITNMDVDQIGREVYIRLREPYFVIIARFILKNVEIDLSKYVPSVIYYGRETPRKSSLYEYVLRAKTSSFHSIILKYFIDNALVSNLHISVDNAIYISRGSLNYIGMILLWVTTTSVSATQPFFTKRLLYRLGILLRSLVKPLQKLKLKTLLLKTPSPQRGK